MTDFKKFKEKLPGEEKVYSSSASKKKIMTKNMNMFLTFRINSK